MFRIIVRFEDHDPDLLGSGPANDASTDMYIDQFGELTDDVSQSLEFDSWFEAHDHLGMVIELMADDESPFELLSVRIDKI